MLASEQSAIGKIIGFEICQRDRIDGMDGRRLLWRRYRLGRMCRQVIGSSCRCASRSAAATGNETMRRSVPSFSWTTSNRPPSKNAVGSSQSGDVTSRYQQIPLKVDAALETLGGLIGQVLEPAWAAPYRLRLIQVTYRFQPNRTQL